MAEIDSTATKLADALWDGARDESLDPILAVLPDNIYVNDVYGEAVQFKKAEPERNSPPVARTSSTSAFLSASGPRQTRAKPCSPASRSGFERARWRRQDNPMTNVPRKSGAPDATPPLGGTGIDDGLRVSTWENVYP
jgi:hypothetical protein